MLLPYEYRFVYSDNPFELEGSKLLNFHKSRCERLQKEVGVTLHRVNGEEGTLLPFSNKSYRTRDSK